MSLTIAVSYCSIKFYQVIRVCIGFVSDCECTVRAGLGLAGFKYLVMK